MTPSSLTRGVRGVGVIIPQGAPGGHSQPVTFGSDAGVRGVSVIIPQGVVGGPSQPVDFIVT